MRQFRRSYWLLRTDVSATWWIRRFDLRTARRLLGFAVLAARGRLTIMDERRVRSAGGYEYLQLELVRLPLPRGGGEAGRGDRGATTATPVAADRGGARRSAAQPRTSLLFPADEQRAGAPPRDSPGRGGA